MHNILRKLKLLVVPASKAQKRANRIKDEVYQALKMSRPRGVEFSVKDDIDKDPDLGPALERLVKEHPEVTVLRTGQSLSFFFRADLDPTLAPETRTAMNESGHLIPGGSPVKGGLFNG